MKVELLAQAEQDLSDGFEFYESQEEGLGAYFLEQLYLAIGSLTVCAGIHSKPYKNYFRLLSKRFPYGVFYEFQNNTVRVVAVMDCRRDPAWLKLRLP